MKVVHFRREGSRLPSQEEQCVRSLLLNESPGVLFWVRMKLQKGFGLSFVLRDQPPLNLFQEAFSMVRSRVPNWSIYTFSVPNVNVFDRPIIIVGAPRAGTTLLFETLAQCPDTWTVGGESHPIFEPAEVTVHAGGHRLEARDATEELAGVIKAALLSLLRNRADSFFLQQCGLSAEPPKVRLLEKTPRNSLKIPFLREIFPDCRLIFIHREPEGNIASLIEGWCSGKAGACDISGYIWRYLLPPGWKALLGKPIPEICAAQWRAANKCILDDLAAIPRHEWCSVKYEDLVRESRSEILRICRFASLRIDARLAAILKRPLPMSGSMLTPPHPDKWRRHEDAVNRVLSGVRDVATVLANLSEA